MSDPTIPDQADPEKTPLQPPVTPIEFPMGDPPSPATPFQDPVTEGPVVAPGEPPDFLPHRESFA